MKKMRQLFAVLMVAVMMLTMSAAAFAANGTNNDKGTITIDNAVVGQSYSIYQIFTLESYNTDPNGDSDTEDGVYAYTVSTKSDWYDFVNTGDGKDYVTLTKHDDTTYYVTWKDSKNTADDYAAFAKLALAYAKTQVKDGSNQDVDRIAATDTKAADSTTVTFSNLNLGYYLADTTLGTLCSLDTTADSVTIKEKNREPSVDKTVQEGDVYGDSNDANIGDTVTFQTVVTAYQGAQNYVLHDKMSEGLTFDSVSNVVLKRTGSADVTLIARSDTVTTAYSAANKDGYMYEVVTDDLEDKDPCTFHIVFVQAYLDTLQKGDQLVVTYTAVLNEDAVIGGAGNTNDTKLDYGDHSSTAWDETTTYTWELNIYKYTDYGASNTPLADARFQLKKADASGEYDKNAAPVNFAEVKDNGNTLTGYQVCTLTGCSHSHVAEIVSDARGNISIEGLDSGTYYLVETDAPNGYNKLSGPVKVVIGTTTDNHTVAEKVIYYNYDASNGYTNAVENTASDYTVRVLNHAGAELPSTGGTGTVVFYILGAILVVGVGVLLVTRRRMSAEK